MPGLPQQTVRSAAEISRQRGRQPLATFAFALLVACIAWGAFAFGAVYPWAYWPLAAAAVVVAAAGLASFEARAELVRDLRWLCASLVLLFAAIAIQLIPLHPPLVARLSPDAIPTMRQISPTAAAGLLRNYTLSIWPAATRTALVLYGCFAFTMIGSASLFSAIGVRRFAVALTWLGVALAAVGIVQAPLYHGLIYGFWQPKEGWAVFGPFVNRAHFDGWMGMALPVTLGLTCAIITREFKTMRPTWRDRVMWIGTPAASILVLLTAAASLMTLAVLLSTSRSGVVIVAFGLIVTLARLWRKHSGKALRAATVIVVVALATFALTFAGPETVGVHVTHMPWRTLNNRWGPWEDAIGVARRFPLAGTGLNTYSYAMFVYQRHLMDQAFTQAHNDYLQLAAEGGALVCIPAALCVICFVLAARRRLRDEVSATTYWIRAGAITGLAAIAIQDVVDFSLQMPGNALLFAILCGVALHRTATRAVR